jgi:hypothetical protein
VRFLGTGPRGPIRLLMGMVNANRPWRLIPQLSGAFAGALAIGAYVVVNQSLWRLSNMLAPLRLMMASIFAVTAMVVWLVIDHHLWERPSGRNARKLSTTMPQPRSPFRWVYRPRILGSSRLVWSPRPDSRLVQETLGHPVSLTNYATIAWLAASMATVGGAIGSGPGKRRGSPPGRLRLPAERTPA